MQYLAIFWDILRTLIVIGVIIFIHELGHFLAAKKVKVKVERFSIGFGPKLAGFRRGDTEYRISWLPVFGGYVKMAGENPNEQKDEEGQFFRAPVSHRALIAISGPGMNIIFAVFFIASAYMIGLPPRPGTEIGYVEPGSPAERAGIKEGDKILSVGGYKVRKWDDIRENIGINPNKEIEIVLSRLNSLTYEKEKITIVVRPERIEGTEFGKIGISPPVPPVISLVRPNSPADKIGFREGDVIQMVDGSKVTHVIEFADELERARLAQKRTVTLTISRDGSNVFLLLPLELDGSGQIESMDGLSFGRAVRLDPISAFLTAIPETVHTGGKVFQFLKRLIVRDVPAKYIAGPLGIVQITMSVVKTGFAGILWFAGFLSVNLGIVNLLPLFITDGGVLVFLFIERLRRKPMSGKMQILVQQVGVGFIVFLFLLITYNDILRMVRGAM